jgi:hypothetical protein
MPIFEVFSRKCGVSEITDAGIAIASFFFSIPQSSFKEESVHIYAQLKS